MLRKVVKEDKPRFVEMMNDFYHTDAVTEMIPEENFGITFDYILNDDPYVDGYMLEVDGTVVGYCIFSITYSNEVAGHVIWLEELYIEDQYQGQGLGKQAMTEINDTFETETSAFRLEVSPQNKSLVEFYSRYGYEQRTYIQMMNPLEDK